MPWIEKIKKKNPKEIYVISNTGLSYGDYLMLTPVFRALKEKYYNADIVFCTKIDEETNILYGNPNLSSIMDYDQFLNIYKGIEKRFEVQIDGVYQVPSIVRDEIFRKKNAYSAYCEDLGLIPSSYLPEYNIQDLEIQQMRDLLLNHGINVKEKFIVIQTEASSPIRNWHPDYVLDLANKLSQKYKVILLGSYYSYLKEKTKNNDNIVTFINKLSIRKACAILYLSSLVICPDSLFAHVCGSFSKKCLVLMSSFSGKLRYSMMPTIEVLQKSYFCAPCFIHNIECCDLGKQHNLPRDERGNYYSMPCMLSISPNEVYNKSIELLYDM